MAEYSAGRTLQGVGGRVGDIERTRRRVYGIVEGAKDHERSSEIFDRAIVALILFNIVAFCLETVPSIGRPYAMWFQAFEVFSIAVFTAEYVARIWSAVEVPYLKRMPAWRARLVFAAKPALLIDLLAILPFYLSMFFAIDLRVLRVLRLLRFLKLARYSPAISTLVRVIANERRSLGAAGLLLAGALLIASTGMYYLESEVQPDKFGSVPEAAYWAMTTLTTVGYGDVTPVTAAGKFFSMVAMLAGLCILALPVAIISTGFAQEVGRRDFVITWSLMSRVPLLAELDAGQVAGIMPLFHAHQVPPGVAVIPADVVSDAMYFVASGRVELRRPSFTHVYETGDFFGAVSMLESEPTSAPFVALTKCRLLKLYQQDFRQLETLLPAVASHVRATAAARRAARTVAEKAQQDAAS